MLPKISEWISLPEKDFLSLLQATAEKTGNVGDVFVSMVAYNVPNYVLKKLWPERWQEELASPRLMSFCVAEKGWQGKIENIQSKVTKIKEKYILTFQKSFVLQAEALIVCARYNDNLVLTRVPASPDDPGQDWVSRGEDDICFQTSDGTTYDHFMVEGEMALAEQYMKELSTRAYARVGLEIPRREFTSLAIVATGILKHHGIYQSELDVNVNNIFNDRSNDRIKSALGDADTIVEKFFQLVKDNNVNIHPFWARSKQLFSHLAKRI